MHFGLPSDKAEVMGFLRAFTKHVLCYILAIVRPPFGPVFKLRFV